ncbi:hypothetical protein BD311DRAFT_771653 [Dichomitus squalens]|uniref:Uncharacterized protein n=1 Tax=Dichomitus squalens TaxID=114155 RepID=A0A4Q9M4C8_9APHY|nr:hypothetical protein BD311DRAFT_771653 [Dichomitus squalens]
MRRLMAVCLLFPASSTTTHRTIAGNILSKLNRSCSEDHTDSRLAHASGTHESNRSHSDYQRHVLTGSLDESRVEVCRHHALYT